jgi:hypothetical protein
MNVNPKFASVLDELINKIRVKKGQRTRATMEDCDLRSHMRRDMRKLEGNISASDKENIPREFVQLQELIAGRRVFSARKPQICRYVPGRNDDVPSLQCLVTYLYCRWTSEACPAMERCDACVREPLFAPLWNGFGEGPLETHEIGPIDPKRLRLNAFPFIRRAQSAASAAPTSTFFGSHPRRAQVPPNGLESAIATCHPASRHRDATAEAVDPVPMAITSNVLVVMSSKHRCVGKGANS